MLRSGVFAEGGKGVGSYLAEAASAIFKPTKSDVPWEGTGSAFSGRITHHEEVARLKKVYELVKEAREAVRGAVRELDVWKGCNSSNASPTARFAWSSCIIGVALVTTRTLGVVFYSSLQRRVRLQHIR